MLICLSVRVKEGIRLCARVAVVCNVRATRLSANVLVILDVVDVVQ